MKTIIPQLKKIKALQQESVFEIDRLLEALNQDDPAPEEPGITNLQARWDGDRILVTWQTAAQEIDILYKHPARQSYISIQQMMHDSRFNPAPLDAAAGEYSIGGVFNIEWTIKAVSGRWDDAKKAFRSKGEEAGPVILKEKDDTVDPEPPEPDPEPEPEEKKFIYYGLWDYKRQHIAEEFTAFSSIGKAMDRSVSGITIPAIMHLGINQGNEETRIKSIEDFDNGNTIIVHFVDEPIGKGMDTRKLDELVEYARTLYGDKYKYAYTLNSHELVNHNQNHPPDQYYPQKFDYVFHQCYPYRSSKNWINIGNPDSTEATTEQELRDWLDNRLDILNEKIPNSRYFIIGQSFSYIKKDGSGWRTPPGNAPAWYVKWCMQAEKVDGLLWWLYWPVNVDESLQGMETYKAAVKEAFLMIPSQAAIQK